MAATKIKLNSTALGLALGIPWALSVLLMGLLATYLTYGTAFVSAMGNVFIGYEPSVTGSIIGGLIAFVDGFVAGAVIGWLYNLFSDSFAKKH